jgi:ubiquinone/menaquinone biosynthesis C-methylase UbiE
MIDAIEPFQQTEAAVSQNKMKEDWEARAREATHVFIDDRAHSEVELKALGEADAAMILADINQYLSPDAAILEIGCGNGRLMEPMARRFREVWGVDISAEMLKRGRERLADFANVNFVENNGSDLAGVPSDYFDLCYSYFTFRHLTEHVMTERYLREAFRILKPQGMLKVEISGVYANNPFRQLYDESHADSWQGVRFSMSEIVKLLEEIGFQMIAAYHPHQPQQFLAANAAHEDIEKQRRLWVVARKDRSMDEWEAVCYASGQALAQAIPSDAAVLLPEPEMENHLMAAGAGHAKFLYLDAPEDGAGAIAAIENGRERGAQFLLFSRYSLWWLEVYPDFAAYLDARYRVIRQSQVCVIYDLRKESPKFEG